MFRGLRSNHVDDAFSEILKEGVEDWGVWWSGIAGKEIGEQRKKNLITFHYTGWLIGISTMGYNKPYSKG